MAYNKNNLENQPLTPKQEKFVECIMQGMSQYEAYLEAYPASKKWKRNSVDVQASLLMDNENIKRRLEQLGWKDKTKVYWTRNKALETINYVMDLNKADMERINQAYEDEIQLLNAQLLELASQMQQAKTPQQAYNISKQMQEITADIAFRNKQRRVNSTNIRGVFEGAKILNRMFGYDITKVEIAPEDKQREEMKELTVEELRAIAYANINKGNTDEG